jgi:hypothetical protein
VSTLYAWPEAGRLDRRIPRDVVFRRAGGGKTIRSLYEEQVDRIDWSYKLFGRSVNLPPANGVTEIQVIQIALRGAMLDDRVLVHLDKALPRQTWFELVRQSPDGPEVQTAAAYKRASEVDAAKVLAREHWRGAWRPQNSARAGLPPAVTLEGLYAGLLRGLWPYGARMGESLRDHAERLSQIAVQSRAAERLRMAVLRESDFARQVERNQALRAAEARLKVLIESP